MLSVTGRTGVGAGVAVADDLTGDRAHRRGERHDRVHLPFVDLDVVDETEYDQIEGIRILKQHWEEKKPVEWVQIHRLPEHVQFRHNRHIQAGVDCQRCHGDVASSDTLPLVKDSHIGYLVPVAKLEMGWCIECHRSNTQQASQDCLTCHY